MRLKHIKNAEEIISKSKYLVKSPRENKGNWNKVFNNDNNIEVEIGMGKGKFIIEKAIQNPNINYIGIEKYDSPLVSAVKKLEELEINNLKLICIDALGIEEVFDHEIDKIYLNFSDPWPKKRHAKRRLTSSIFLNKYENLFKNEKHIEMKTDNDDLYDYSCESFIENGYDIVKTDTNYLDTIRTEYEDKFISLGKNINYISVVKK
ncbi:MAG: tRNA (guanosine(46)-N7)-methyltransferase TrmB [Mollicutes bacterium]|nr:tRNA (guanosine(46)-N7)-methyltransferase TrmB [Mollicutes bacterium]